MTAVRGTQVDSCPCWDLRVHQAGQIIERARHRGERTSTARQVVDHVIAPLYHHAIFGLKTDADYAAALVADILAMRA